MTYVGVTRMRGGKLEVALSVCDFVEYVSIDSCQFVNPSVKKSDCIEFVFIINVRFLSMLLSSVQNVYRHVQMLSNQETVNQ